MASEAIDNRGRAKHGLRQCADCHHGAAILRQEIRVERNRGGIDDLPVHEGVLKEGMRSGLFTVVRVEVSSRTICLMPGAKLPILRCRLPRHDAKSIGQCGPGNCRGRHAVLAMVAKICCVGNLAFDQAGTLPYCNAPVPHPPKARFDFVEALEVAPATAIGDAAARRSICGDEALIRQREGFPQPPSVFQPSPPWCRGRPCRADRQARTPPACGR